MADRKPDKGLTSERSFDTIKFESQAGYEKRDYALVAQKGNMILHILT